jgi:hypothetical protein
VVAACPNQIDDVQLPLGDRAGEKPPLRTSLAIAPYEQTKVDKKWGSEVSHSTTKEFRAPVRRM